MTHNTFKVHLNGKQMTAIVFKPGDRVSNYYGDRGTVDNADNPLLVNVIWDKDNSNRPGRTWLATSLSLI